MRIFTVAGTTVSVSPNTLVYQICGELTLFDDVPRRFFQTIVLVSQVAKAYYLESNIFQWVDTAFSINFKNINSEESLLNGDLQSHQVSISPSPDESDQKFQLELKNNRMVNGTSENRVTELITSKGIFLFLVCDTNNTICLQLCLNGFYLHPINKRHLCFFIPDSIKKFFR